ncbi:uncharacterized protein LOC134208273 [Armigeres subalbatus]|uniref:uncharacterized protein LOC134208273 n=1 Tax=Armigeres subalbatus TaxID=124917 RepID=UPI002ED58017
MPRFASIGALVICLVCATDCANQNRGLEILKSIQQAMAEQRSPSGQAKRSLTEPESGYDYQQLGLVDKRNAQWDRSGRTRFGQTKRLQESNAEVNSPREISDKRLTKITQQKTCRNNDNGLRLSPDDEIIVRMRFVRFLSDLIDDLTEVAPPEV